MVPPGLTKGALDFDPSLELEAAKPIAATAVALDMAAAAWTSLARKYWKAWTPIEELEEIFTEQAKSQPYSRAFA